MPKTDVILKVDNISKQYRLGLVGTGTLSHDLNRWWSKIRGKEDPYLRVGDSNDRSTKGNSDYVWALKDINFEVQQGEVLGIIGKNGAGKSTLLKILSRVTSPSTGAIKTKGRIASLLEVGTGFHGEMTGRENIYLNGAILGMTKKEISSKIDEIIEFSGCQRYIDTPVKRYSSGMTVRLAFAVAAFLEPDILVVDEVLAVGDAEFQKKAIGKMQDISKGDGRTVLFVSHNMASVKKLCTRGIVLENGSISMDGSIDDCIKYYIKDEGSKIQIKKELFPLTNENFKLSFNNIKLIDQNIDELCIEIKIEAKKPLEGIGFGFRIKDVYDLVIASFTPSLTGINIDIEKGESVIQIKVKDFKKVVAGGVYFFDVWAAVPKVEIIIHADRVFSYTVEDKDVYGTGVFYDKARHGLLQVNGEINVVE